MYKYLVSSAVLVGLSMLVAPPGARAAEHTAQRSMKAFLGATVAETPSSAAHEGVLIRQVLPDSPAAKAGLQRGDIITQVGTRPVEDFDDLANAINRHQPGDHVRFQVWRNDQEKNVAVTLGKRSRRQIAQGEESGREEQGQYGRLEGQSNRERQGQYGQQTGGAFLGVQTRELTSALRRRENLATDEGVFVAAVEPDSPAAAAGLRSGDVILSINGKDVATPQELRRAIQRAGVGKRITLDVQRGNQEKELHARLQNTEQEEYGTEPSTSSNREIRALRRRIEQLENRLEQLEQHRQSGSSSGSSSD